MAKSETAMAAIAALYAKQPDATLEQFLDAASAADPAVAGMAKRSFNATYLLPMKRAAAPKKPRKAGRKPMPGKAARRGRKPGAAKAAAKATDKPAPARRGRKPAARPAGNASAARRLVLQRDQKLLTALRSGGDPKAAYELAASIDDFVNELVSALRG